MMKRKKELIWKKSQGNDTQISERILAFRINLEDHFERKNEW